jgi:hypothetical protein
MRCEIDGADENAVIGSKATATFTSQNGKAESLQMKGGFLAYSADITDTAQGGKFLRARRLMRERQ